MHKHFHTVKYEEFMLTMHTEINPNLQCHCVSCCDTNNSGACFGMIHNLSGKYICFCHAVSIKLPIG